MSCPPPMCFYWELKFGKADSCGSRYRFPWYGLLLPTHVCHQVAILLASICESGFHLILKTFLSIHLYIQVLSDTLPTHLYIKVLSDTLPTHLYIKVLSDTLPTAFPVPLWSIYMEWQELAPYQFCLTDVGFVKL